MEQRAERAERELTKLKLLNYFADRVGEEMEAVVSGVEPFGLFAQGIEIPVEGLIPVDNLPDDSYQYDRSARTLSGYHSENQYRLGDRVLVCVSFVDTTNRQLEFRLVKVTHSTPRADRSRGRKGKKPARQSAGKRGLRSKTAGKSKSGKKVKSGLTRKSKKRKGKFKAKKSGSTKKGATKRGDQRKSKTKRKTVSKIKKPRRK